MTDKERAVMQQALDALVNAHIGNTESWGKITSAVAALRAELARDFDAEQRAINAQDHLRADEAELAKPPAAIASRQQAEPVAWTLLLVGEHHGIIGKAGDKFVGHPAHYDRVDVYTAPPQRTPLTLDEVRDLCEECGLDWHKGFMPLFDDDPTNRYEVLIRAIEQAHGIQETPTSPIREHATNAACWCHPTLDYTDPETGVSVYIHKDPQ